MSTSQDKVLIIGDLHISDKYSGRHVDYFRDCIDFLADVTEEIKKNSVTHLILTGDLVGRTTEKNFQSREALLYFMQVLQVWNQLTHNQVYACRGNHDMGQHLTDFEVVKALGYLKQADYLDLGFIRFHLLNYGDHNRSLTIDPQRYNVAVTHTELHVDGLTSWFFRSKEAVDLASLKNFSGIDLVVGGHIHRPSLRMVSTTIDGHDIQLFYPGNGTRPAYDSNLWDKCYGVLLSSDETQVSLGQVTFQLKPVEESFSSTFDDLANSDTEEEDQPLYDVAQLAEILKQLNDYNLVGEGDYKTQLKRLGGLDQAAVNLALRYIEQVEGEMK